MQVDGHAVGCDGLSDSHTRRGNRFLRSERLHLRRESLRLFTQGSRVFKFPYRGLYHFEFESRQPGLAVMVQAPKRLFKRATDRNRQKRRMREAFRLQAHPLRALAEDTGCRVTLAIIVVSNEVVAAERGHRAVGVLLRAVCAALHQRSGKAIPEMR